MKIIDCTGKKYGRLTSIRFAKKEGEVRYWLFQCDCGKLHTTVAAQVRSGQIKSCGCLQREAAAKPRAGKHRMIKSAEYRIWCGMRRRCRMAADNPRHGGRGISVCARWEEDFAAFYADMGARPTPNHSLDRIDNNGSYEPNNCRWATAKQQAANRHNSMIVTVDGKEMPLTDAAVALGIHYQTLYWRFKRNKPLVRAA